MVDKFHKVSTKTQHKSPQKFPFFFYKARVYKLASALMT